MLKNSNSRGSFLKQTEPVKVEANNGLKLGTYVLMYLLQNKSIYVTVHGIVCLFLFYDQLIRFMNFDVISENYNYSYSKIPE